MKKIVFLITFLPLLLIAQNNPLDIFKPLENLTWKAEGIWGDGSAFKQEINFQFTLNDKLVKVETNGFVDKSQTQFGLRNHGVRQYDDKQKKIVFWEFDIFGNLTKGFVESKDKNFIYTYDYSGTLVTEMWIYKNKTTYGFVVGVYNNGKWEQKFLETEFKGFKK